MTVDSPIGNSYKVDGTLPLTLLLLTLKQFDDYMTVDSLIGNSYKVDDHG